MECIDLRLTATLSGGLVGGAVTYIIFRLLTDRKLPPSNSNDLGGIHGRLCMRRPVQYLF